MESPPQLCAFSGKRQPLDPRLPFSIIHADPYLMDCQCASWRKPCPHMLKERAEYDRRYELASGLTGDDITWLLNNEWDGVFAR